MTEASEITQRINARFNHLTASLEDARAATGVQSEGRIVFAHTEQANARRELLRVEKQAIRDKQLNQKSQQHYINSIRKLVHEELHRRLQTQLGDTQMLIKKVLGLDQSFPALLDTLSIKLASIAKLEAVATDIAWLYDDLIKMANLPEYRRTDAKGRAVYVESLRHALGFFGFENLKMLLPSMALKRWLPQITDPYPEIKNRLWEGALGTAISCRCIAEVQQQDTNHAFTLGMFHDLGRLVIVRLYFRLFEQVQMDALIEALDNQKRDEHAALARITPSCDFLSELIDRYAVQLSARLLQAMQLQRLPIANALHEFADGQPVNQASPLAQTLIQGAAYTKYRLLKQHKLINLDESKQYLLQFRFPARSLSLLKTKDLSRLDLTFEE